MLILKVQVTGEAWLRYQMSPSELYREESQNKNMFIQFVRKMVAWDPNERKTARELLTEPWVQS